MAKIIINKGFISYGGRFYKAGEIVPIADNNYAKRIVARSGGDFDFYHGEKEPATDEAETQATENENPGGDEEDGGVSDGQGRPSVGAGAGRADFAPTESDTEYNDGIGGGLPAIDADAAVQTKNAKGKKR